MSTTTTSTPIRVWFRFLDAYHSVVGNFEYISDVASAIHVKLGKASPSAVCLQISVKGQILKPEDDVSSSLPVTVTLHPTKDANATPLDIVFKSNFITSSGRLRKTPNSRRSASGQGHRVPNDMSQQVRHVNPNVSDSDGISSRPPTASTVAVPGSTSSSTTSTSCDETILIAACKTAQHNSKRFQRYPHLRSQDFFDGNAELLADHLSRMLKEKFGKKVSSRHPTPEDCSDALVSPTPSTQPEWLAIFCPPLPHELHTLMIPAPTTRPTKCVDVIRHLQLYTKDFLVRQAFFYDDGHKDYLPLNDDSVKNMSGILFVLCKPQRAMSLELYAMPEAPRTANLRSAVMMSQYFNQLYNLMRGLEQDEESYRSHTEHLEYQARVALAMLDYQCDPRVIEMKQLHNNSPKKAPPSAMLEAGAAQIRPWFEKVSDQPRRSPNTSSSLQNTPHKPHPKPIVSPARKTSPVGRKHSPARNAPVMRTEFPAALQPSPMTVHSMKYSKRPTTPPPEPIGETTVSGQPPPNTVWFYSSNDPVYGCFANFYECPMNMCGHLWLTVEHYFQAMKFIQSPHDFAAVHSAKTAKEAAAIGRDRSRPKRKDWADVKHALMYDAVLAKFQQNPALQKVLLDTGDQTIVEHTSHDNYWGDGGDGSGKNMLGVTLMKVRYQIRAELTEWANEVRSSESKVQKILPLLTVSETHMISIPPMSVDGPSTATTAQPAKDTTAPPQNTIWFYAPEAPFGCFSAFYECPIKLRGNTWPSVEHYYQAMKYVKSPFDFVALQNAATPMEAAKKGRDPSRQVRADWNEARNTKMYDAVLAKFEQNLGLQKVLLDTGDQTIVEHTSHDNYWGDGGDGSGKNILGVTLMKVRGWIRGRLATPTKLGEQPVQTSQVPAPSTAVSTTEASRMGITTDSFDERVGEACAPPQNTIWFYAPEAPFGCFSAFYECPIKLRGNTWPSVEHYYQAMKYVKSPFDFVALQNAATPMEAAKKGRDPSRQVRADWNEARNTKMYDAVLAKFEQNLGLQKVLLDTGDQTIVEHTSHDNYWGDGGDGSGKNNLGVTLMKVRGWIRGRISVPIPVPIDASPVTTKQSWVAEQPKPEVTATVVPPSSVDASPKTKTDIAPMKSENVTQFNTAPQPVNSEQTNVSSQSSPKKAASWYRKSTGVLPPENTIWYTSTAGEYGCFNNAYEAPFVFEGEELPTAEDHFMGKKATFSSDEDWEKSRDAIMYNVVLAKFQQNPDLAKILLSSGGKDIVKRTKIDMYWGDGYGKGENKMGKVLMKVRAHLQEQPMRASAQQSSTDLGERQTSSWSEDPSGWKREAKQKVGNFVEGPVKTTGTSVPPPAAVDAPRQEQQTSVPVSSQPEPKKDDQPPHNAVWFYSSNDPVYGCFANFYECTFKVGGIAWPSVEHFFQGMKFEHSPYDFAAVQSAPTPKEAAAIGRDRNRPKRKDWADVKNDLMYDAVLAKFEQNLGLQKVLLDTGDQTIVEHTSHDNYWGDGGDGSGKNILGVTLMKVRGWIRGRLATPTKLGEQPVQTSQVPAPVSHHHVVVPNPIDVTPNAKQETESKHPTTAPAPVDVSPKLQAPPLSSETTQTPPLSDVTNQVTVTHSEKQHPANVEATTSAKTQHTTSEMAITSHAGNGQKEQTTTKTADQPKEAAAVQQPSTIKLQPSSPSGRYGKKNYKARLTKFFEKYCPEMTGVVDETLQSVYGAEETLFAALIEKYGPEPTE